MKIFTVNLPKTYLKAIELLVGNDGLYPSRSELVRVAVKDFLYKKIELIKRYEEEKKKVKINPNFVKVPWEKDQNGITIFKKFLLIKNGETNGK